ncbi:MAG: flagellar protein FlaG [Magnetococcus sp. DMHC-6]
MPNFDKLDSSRDPKGVKVAKSAVSMERPLVSNQNDTLMLKNMPEENVHVSGVEIGYLRANLDSLTQEVANALANFSSLKFTLDLNMNRVVVRVLDRQRNESLIRIPSEKKLDFVKQLNDLDGKFRNVLA